MAFNGSGTFARIYDWTTDEGNGINIEASRMDGEDDGFATGLSTCITKDGQTTISANIPFNSKKITGLANGSTRTDSIALGQVQDGTYLTLGTAGGSADAYTATPSPAITAYATGSRYILKIQADNTDASTLNISAVGDKDIKKYDGAGAKVDPEAGDLQQDQYYDIFYDGTDIVVMNPQNPYINLTNTSSATTSAKGVSLLPKQVIMSNGTDADHDIDFAAGVFQFSAGDGQASASALTKQIDATWVAGTAAGGLADALTVANDTWYYCFALSTADGSTTDFGFDTSFTATNLLADSAVVTAELTKFKYLGALRTEGSANIREFRQSGKEFYYLNKTTNTYTASNPGTSQNTQTMLVPALSGVVVQVMFKYGQVNNPSDRYALVRSSLESDSTPTSTNHDIHLIGGAGGNFVLKYIPTDDSQIWMRVTASDTNTRVGLNTISWIDNNL